MSSADTPERYGVISTAFHWLSAVVVYGMFALGLWMITLSYYDDWYHKTPELHRSIGILLMMELVIYVLWRAISSPPGPLPNYSSMIHLAVRTGHLVLYLLLFVIGISGCLIPTADGEPINVFGWFDVPAILTDADAQADFAGALYFWLTWNVVVLSVMHEFMTLKHHFIGKDDTLKRTLGKSLSDYGAQKMKKSLLGLTFVPLTFSASLTAAADYKTDKEGRHAFANSRIQHLGYSWSYGTSRDFDGIFTFGEKNSTVDRANMTINATSADINRAEHGKRLRSADFLNTAKYPRTTFTSTNVKKGSDELDTTGDPTLNGIIKSATLEARLIGQDDDPWGGRCVGLEAEGKIKSKDFNIKTSSGSASQEMDLITSVEGIQ